MRPEDEQYFERIEAELDRAMAVAEEAKTRGDDPRPEIEIPTARDMADRVENILGIDGVAERVRTFETETDLSREEIALALVEDFVEGRVGDYETDAGTVEGAVRTAVALLTEGVVAAPIEGIDRVEVNQNDDGSSYVAVYYAGPIRSAGGTAQALSVLVADYARTLLGIDRFKPRDDEIERYAEEVDLYESETGLQYAPKDKETKYIVEHCPIMLDGEATGQEEVSGYRDLERIDTNAPRGGMCLVLAEGIALKAPKIRRYTRDLEDLAWPWLQDLIDGTIGGHDDETGEETTTVTDEDETAATTAGPPRVDASDKYLRDLIAGRPVFGHPSEPGGFRLRYGRTRNLGDATAGIHPATMRITEDFLAPGTQIKTELPGKAAGVVPVDSIEGPTVRLANGDVRRIDDAEEAKALRNGIDRIIDLGEYLVNYGEFVENNHELAPASYVFEWWTADMQAAGADIQAMRDDASVDLATPAPTTAIEWAQTYDAPLHPTYTYLWHDIDVDQFDALAAAVADGEVVEDALRIRSDVAAILETLLVEHHQGDDRITLPEWRPLAASLGVTEDLKRTWTLDDLSTEVREWPNAMRAVEAVAPFAVRERAPTRVGSRMGRPEKSEDRELSPAVHTLFPIGEAGGDQRDVGAAASHTDSLSDTPGEVEAEVGIRACPDCDIETFWPRCPECGSHIDPRYTCPECGQELQPDESGRVYCERCEVEGSAVESRPIDVRTAYREALDAVGERDNAFEILKGVKGLTSALKTPEPLEKGVLRAKHDVSAFKDGTVRYDMTDLPVTSVKPAELGVSVDRFRQLGYEEDIHGDPLRHEDQLVELKVQDVILSEGAAEHMLKTANFVDDLLESYYGLEPYYDIAETDDLVGELVFGMAPHTSAAVVGRVLGFTNVAGGYAHPYFHAAKRRNCFHPATTIRYTDADGWHRTSIETFVERRLADPREDDFGTLIQELDGTVTVPSLDATGQPTTRPVEAVSKHPAQDHLVRIRTHGGRQLTVTPDHTMRRWTSTGVEGVSARSLAEGDQLPVPTLDSDASSKAGVDVGDPQPAYDGGSVALDTVAAVDIQPSSIDHTYSLTVADTHTLVANDTYVGQCDGDEDCVMLLMDGLLNFSKAYLPDKRGGSVTADSRLLVVDPEGAVRVLSIEEFWDALETPAKRDGKFRKKPCVAEGWQTYAFDDNHQVTLQPIEKAIRYRAAPEATLLEVETQRGRSITITEHHSLFRYDDGIEEVAGAELAADDLVVAPQSFAVEPVETTIDVAACVETPRVCVDGGVARELPPIGARPDGGSAIESPDTMDSVPLARIESQLADTDRDLPADLRICGERDDSGIRRHLEVDTSLAWVLGAFVAAGEVIDHHPTIRTPDRSVADRIAEAAHSALACDPTIRSTDDGHAVSLPPTFAAVLADLDLAQPQSIPQCIRRAPRDVVVAFLKGLERVSAGRPLVRTTSESLKDGVVFLLHRLGVVGTIDCDETAPGASRYTVLLPSGMDTDDLTDGDPIDRTLAVSVPQALIELQAIDHPAIEAALPTPLDPADDITLAELRAIVDALADRSLPASAERHIAALEPLVAGDLAYLRVEDINRVGYDGYLYDLQVGGEPIFTADWLYAHNSMDAPLVMSSRIDPAEIDDEAHNIDIMDAYPREFYEATRELAHPEEVEAMTIAEERVGTDDEYHGFAHTHSTTDIAAGPDLSAYKTLESMTEKMDAQLELARRLRAVDETDVAERIIEYHFLPDLIGNLRAFSRQEVRCLDCGTKYRRMPLTGQCRNCGGDVTLTVHEGSVSKYLDTAIRIAEEYGARDYTKQRLEVLERSIERIFEDDTSRQSGIADFM